MAYTEINQSDLIGIFDYANSVSDNYFGAGLLVSLYLIIFFYLKVKGGETTECFAAAGFISSILGALLLFLGLISNKALFISVVLLIVPLLWSYFLKD